jgi:hypothetical protein
MIDHPKGHFRALLHLDECSSDGARNNDFNLDRARLMALAIRDNCVWYGFVISRCGESKLRAGETVLVEVTFLNGSEAELVFNLKSSIIFGDGVNSKGTVTLIDRIQG